MSTKITCPHCGAEKVRLTNPSSISTEPYTGEENKYCIDTQMESGAKCDDCKEEFSVSGTIVWEQPKPIVWDMDFIAMWGNWEPAATNSYDTKTDTINSRKITENEGYTAEDIHEIKRLKIGEVWGSPLGNHKLMRIV